MKAYEAVTDGFLILSAIVLTATLSFPGRTGRPSPKRLAKSRQALPSQLSTRKGATAAPTSDAAPRAAQRHERATQVTDTHTRVIVVSLEDRRLALVEDGQVKQIYSVAVGKDSTPSPTGTFTIVSRVSNPSYYHDGKVVPAGPRNPVGDRWMGLDKAGYGIHGTNAPHSIGKAASHGCIRMAQPDLEQLFAEVRTGDTVQIVGTRDEQTIALFGEPAVTGANAPAQTVLAQAAPPATSRDSAATAGESAAPALAAAAVPAVLPLGQ